MKIKKPSECSKEELELFRKLVLEGGQVDAHGLEKRITNCKLLGFYYNDKEELVGVSAIKSKTKESVAAVKAKAEVLNEHFPLYELGYSVTREDSRRQGINNQLNDGLLELVKGGPVYATTDNDTMRKYLAKKGFIKKGKSFTGKYNENLDYF